MSDQKRDMLTLTAKLAKAYVAGNAIPSDALPSLIKELHQSLVNLTGKDKVAVVQQPAITVRQSIKHDRIICLECGKAHKMLKRHLATSHGLTVDEYRARWKLPGDYPLVAPDYAEARSQMAKRIGLGQQRRKNG